MTTEPAPAVRTGTAERDPFELFMGSHTQIREALGAMRSLAAGGDTLTPGPVQRGLAEQLIGCFDSVVLPHHREEEREFWPLASRARADPADHAHFVEAAARLQQEHVDLEARWAALQPVLAGVARGRHTELPAADLTELATRYARHAQFEDEVLVPLARHLLSPTDQSRLAISVLLSRLPAAKWGMV
jgi:hemerythrin-like domain-containing protein